MLCIGTSIVYIRSIEYYENYMFFTLTLSITGLIIGYLIYSIISFLIPYLKNIEIINGHGFKIMTLVSCFFFSLGLGTIINNHFSQYSEIKVYEIIEKISNNYSTKTYYFFISDDITNEKRIPVKHKIYDYYNEGDNIQIERTKGILGGIYFGEIIEN